jgi:signal peptidase
MEKEAGTKSGLKKLGHGIGLAICVFLSLIIIINVTMIVKSYLHPDKVPDFMGYKPFIVLSNPRPSPPVQAAWRETLT